MSSTSTASRRGVTRTRVAATPKPCSTTRGNCPRASGQAPAGSSSQPISTRSVAIGSHVELGEAARKLADTADVRGSLSDRYRAARVEQVEGVRRFQHLVVRRQRQALVEQLVGLGLVLVEATMQDIDGRLLVVVLRPLPLVL